MNKWYRQNNKSAGNRWMLLGSKFAKAFNPFVLDTRTGTRVVMGRKREYEVQSDGSVKRVNFTRTRKRPGIVFTDKDFENAIKDPV